MLTKGHSLDLRGLKALGINVDFLAAAQKNSNFDDNGLLKPSFYSDNKVISSGDLTNINDTLKMLQSFDKPFVLQGAIPWGTDSHYITINQVYIGTDGNFEVKAYDTSINGITNRRKFGLAAKNEDKNYYRINKLRYLYKE